MAIPRSIFTEHSPKIPLVCFQIKVKVHSWNSNGETDASRSVYQNGSLYGTNWWDLKCSMYSGAYNGSTTDTANSVSQTEFGKQVEELENEGSQTEFENHVTFLPSSRWFSIPNASRDPHHRAERAEAVCRYSPVGTSPC